MPGYLKLTYHPGYWLLHKADGQQLKFEKVILGFDGGIFFLLTLAGISPRKSLVVFKDQISITQYRVLKLLM